MKWILPLLILISCKSPNTLQNDIIKEKLIIDSVKVIYRDTVVKSNIKTDSISDEIVSEMIIFRRNEFSNSDEATQVRAITQHAKTTNLTVIDKTTTQKLDTNWGLISYSVPDKMKVGRAFSIKVRISKKTAGQNKAVIILGGHDAINTGRYRETATIEDIRVSGQMSAQLRGDSEWFSINALSTEFQDIDTCSYTEWEWVVVPKASGESPLKLVIKVKDLNKDIIVFNKTIGIGANVGVKIESFFEKYWQWLLTTIIIPIFLFFWNRKRRKKS